MVGIFNLTWGLDSGEVRRVVETSGNETHSKWRWGGDRLQSPILQLVSASPLAGACSLKKRDIAQQNNKTCGSLGEGCRRFGHEARPLGNRGDNTERSSERGYPLLPTATRHKGNLSDFVWEKWVHLALENLKRGELKQSQPITTESIS